MRDRTGERDVEKKNSKNSKKFKLSKRLFSSGTWNVRTLYAPGKLENVEYELEKYEWHVVGLVETRWTGFGEQTTQQGHRFWFSGEDTKRERGVGLLVHKKVVPSVIECTPVSSRFITMRLSAQPFNISIIQVYAPTAASTEDEIDDFYEQLEDLIEKVPTNDYLILQGDFNAKVGTDYITRKWKGVVGEFGCGYTNERGEMLVDFCNTHGLVLANTLGNHKLSRRTTWHSPGGMYHNQIDFVIIRQRFRSSVQVSRTRSFPGADVGSDHDLVLLGVKIKLKRHFKPPSFRKRFNVAKLQSQPVQDAFQAEVGGRFGPLLELTDVNEVVNEFNTIMTDTASRMLGKPQHAKNQWISDECLHACDRRRELRGKRFNSLADRSAYSEANREVKKLIRRDKENWLQSKCKSIEDDLTRHNSRGAYQTVSSLCRDTSTSVKARSTNVIKDKDGATLTTESEVTARWREYCMQLYNVDLGVSNDTLTNISVPTASDDAADLPIVRDEVENAINSLKSNKSAGIDNVPAELLKYGGPAVVDILHRICNMVWSRCEWPESWTKSVLVPIPKSGDLLLCQNYRTVSLISHPSKVMLRILLNRLQPQVEDLLSDEQAGFRRGRSTVEQIFNLRVLMEKYRDHHLPLYHNFIDFKKAFDRVWHKALFRIMRSYGIEPRIVDLIEALYSHAESTVLVGSAISDWFATTVGVRQGCLLSPCLFNLFLEYIMSDALEGFDGSVRIGGVQICNLRFADDIDLIAASVEELVNLTERVDSSARSLGMQINASKTKVMAAPSGDGDLSQVKVDGTSLEEVDQFKYLGATISHDARCEKEIKRRLAIANKKMVDMKYIWSTRSLSLRTKIRFVKASIMALVTYGCQAWTISAASLNRIRAFEMKCMRRVLGITYHDRRTNESIVQEIQDIGAPLPGLVEHIKKSKLTWFGHVSRHNEFAKSFLQGNVPGRRSRGRPQLSWSMNIADWTNQSPHSLSQIALDRSMFRSIVHNSLFG